MQTLKTAEVKSIEQFFKLSQDNLLRVLYKFLKTKYETVHCTKDYIIAVGDIPVALVAHLDTVFKSPPEEIYYDRTKNVMWSPDGLGADDRAGVYSIIQILKQGLKPSIIFTTEEETGAVGAHKIIKDFENAPMDLKYIIELDRRGSIDCVFYECDNPDFEEYVEDFGFVTAWGTFSDISVICPAWGIAGVNLSIGYEDEHSYIERLNIGHMLATIKKVVNMLKAIDVYMEPFKYIPMEYTKAWKWGWGETNNVDYGWDPSWGISKDQWRAWCLGNDIKECYTCGLKDYDYNLFPVKSIGGTTLFMCADCISSDSNIEWCKRCGEAFHRKAGDNNPIFCYDCREKEKANE